MKHPIGAVLSIPLALQVIRKRYDQIFGEWKPEADKVWSSISARPVIWGIDEVSKARKRYASDAVGKLHDSIVQAASDAMDRSLGSLFIVVTSLDFRPDHLKTVRSNRDITWLSLGPIDVSKLWEQSPDLGTLVQQNSSARRFLLDCGGHPRSIALTIGHLNDHPGAGYDQLFASLFASTAKKYRLREFVDGLTLDVLAPCILGLYQDFDPLKRTKTSKAHRERLYLNSTDETSTLQLPFTSPIFVLRACKQNKLEGTGTLEDLIFSLLEQYFELGTSLESRPEFSAEQPPHAKFERAIVLRDVIVRLFLHYQRRKENASAQATVPVRLDELYGIPRKSTARMKGSKKTLTIRSLPALHSAALDAKDIVLKVRQPGELLDLRGKMPLHGSHLDGRDLLSTPIKCTSHQDGMDALFVDRMIKSTASSAKYHELLIECKWSSETATTKFRPSDVQKTLDLMQKQGDRGMPIRLPYDFQ